MDCQVCEVARRTGSWPADHPGTHCGLDSRGPAFDCHRSWKSTAQSHCSECHRHFGSNMAGDAHRIGNDCRDPEGFDRWETPNGVIWGGRDPLAAAARMARIRVRGLRQNDETPSEVAQ